MESITDLFVFWGPYVLAFVLVIGLELLRRRDKNNTSNDMWSLLEFSSVAVSAAEQIFGRNARGEDKYAWVENAMMIAFPKLDKVLIRAWIESAVNSMNKDDSKQAVDYFGSGIVNASNVTIKQL